MNRSMLAEAAGGPHGAREFHFALDDLDMRQEWCDRLAQPVVDDERVFFGVDVERRADVTVRCPFGIELACGAETMRSAVASKS